MKERSAAQKEADKRYMEKVRAEKRYKQFAVPFKVDELAHIESVIASSGKTKADFLRWAVQQWENQQ